MTPSEIAFLALGLLLGSAVGAAIAQSLAWRPGPRREVRVTITPNAIPSRRAYTLAVPNGFSLVSRVPGSPDERQLADHPDDLFASDGGSRGAAVTTTLVAAGRTAPTRTGVPSGPGGKAGSAVGVTVMTVPAGGRVHTDGEVRVASPADPPGLQPPEATAAMPAVAAAVAVLDAPGNASSPVPEAEPAATVAPPAVVLAVPIATVTEAAPGHLPELRTLVRARRPVAAARPVLPVGAVGVRAVRPVAVEGGADPADGPGPAARNAPDAAEPCAPARRVVDERCALADVTREQARGAADALREAQRVYDVLRERVDRAQGTADPRRVAAAKEQLHAEFRVASDQADGPEETETAARAWLSHINQLNAAVREAQRILEAGNAELRAQIPVLDRLAAEADAARIAGENAEAGCVEARQELAACEEADVLARAAVPKTPEEPHPFDGVWPAEQPELPERVPPETLLSGVPLVVRILRGDRDARQRLVASLAAGDAEAEREWQLRVARLVDAIVARAIEDGYLDVPEDHAFWRLFERREARDIVGALSALGYRYDGMGGFADGRVPAARDLSLAVGYAGLDRMRIRTWPRDAEIAALYEHAVVSADEWLADEAGDLSLGRMVDALGNRAAELADLWNAWGRVRPVLLGG